MWYTRSMRACCCLLALLLLTLFSPAATWIAHPAGKTIVYTHPGETALAAEVNRFAADAMPRLESALAMTPTPVTVYAYANRGEFERDTGDAPRLLGVSEQPYGVVRLDATGRRSDVPSVLAHELTHSLLAQRLGDFQGNLPTWVNEGIAGHLSEPVSSSELQGISRLIHRDGVLTLDELHDGFTTGPFRDAAYLQSRSMIAWLVLHYPGVLPRLLDALARGADFDSALVNLTGLHVVDWWQHWQADVPALLYWITILSSPVTYAPVALLVMVLALLRAWRKRREQREQENDEEDDNAVD